MKDFLQDLVAHTHTLGVLPLIKITASDTETLIDSIADDKTVILSAKTHSPISELSGIFGLPNLNKLDLHLKCPEYKENAIIKLIKDIRNNIEVPTGLHFSTASGDFQNEYRFMVQEIVNEKMKSAIFQGANFTINFVPAQASIQKMKFQSAVHTEESVFQVSTKGGNLIFSFGDASTHAGSFVFQSGITGSLKHTWSWPISQVQSILNLNGDITMKFADGCLMITVDSGLAEYNYILPAQIK